MSVVAASLREARATTTGRRLQSGNRYENLFARQGGFHLFK